jgi:signal transduction histidine kinase
MSTFYILNELTNEFEHFESIGANKDLLKPFSSKNMEGEFGIALSKKDIYYLQDIPQDTILKFHTTAGKIIPKEIITIPILIDHTVVALISLVNIRKFSKECYNILEQTKMSINSSYSNLVANEKTRILAENISKVNYELEARTEELQQTSNELQEQNLELEMQRIQVEEADKLKDEFLSNMSHELRTPLNSILTLSHVLLKQTANKLTKVEKNYLEIVERNGKQLLILINDILDLSKIEAGKMSVKLSKISLETELRFIKENVASLAMKKNIELHINTVGIIPEVETDLAKLQQVLTNIIGNALKFTEEGEVNINLSVESEMVYIEVEDTGIGINEDAIPYIFEEFRQVDGSSSRVYEGTGLGLTIAKKMIKILGGDIKV